MLVALFLTASLLSCRAADAPSTQPPAVIPPTLPPVATGAAPIASASAAPAPPGGPCSKLLAHNREMLARFDDTSGPDHPGNDDEFKIAEACVVTPGGAWGLRLDGWENTDPPGSGERAFSFEGQFSVVHLPDGAEIQGLTKLSQGYVSTTIARPALFDHDGDGEPEIFLVVHEHAHEDAGSTFSALYTWKAGAVQLYPGLPANVEESKDIDQDGRPDFLYHPYSEVREAPCSGFGYRWRGPAMVAHSLPGGAFSLDDRVTHEHLLRECAPPPRGKILPITGSRCDSCPHNDCNFCLGESRPPEVCARVHGASEKESRSILRRVCQKPKAPQEECSPPDGVCGDYSEREAILAKIVPAPGATGKGPRKAAPAPPRY
jgi:hypothetical protein